MRSPCTVHTFLYGAYVPPIFGSFFNYIKSSPKMEGVCLAEGTVMHRSVKYASLRLLEFGFWILDEPPSFSI